jgi:hypothetical protein
MLVGFKEIIMAPKPKKDGRLKNTGREARDVLTAIGTAFYSQQGFYQTDPRTGRRVGGADAMSGPGAAKNLKRQIKEVGKAAILNKKGTTSDIIKKKQKTGSEITPSGSRESYRKYEYVKGKTRNKPKGR